MAPAVLTTKRGQALECGRLMAAVFVVFIHARFPGNFGRVVDCLARFAVPFFFAVSGYYCYDEEPRQIGKRLKRTFLLALGANIGYLLLGTLTAWLTGGNALRYLKDCVPDEKGWLELLFLQASPLAGHLWFLNALCLCYLVMWAYEKWGPLSYTPLYITGGFLLLAYLFLEPIGGALGLSVPLTAFRNGWVLGLPLFFSGLFLREYPRKKSVVTTWLGMFLGAALSLEQWFLLKPVELPVGMLLAVPALLTLLLAHPRLPLPAALTEWFSPMSTALYILHPAVLQLYEAFLKKWTVGALGEKEPWLMPLFVLGASLVFALLWAWAVYLGKKRKKA